MIGCWCHDPVVFGHWFGCGRLRLQEPVEEEPLVRIVLAQALDLIGAT